jgi:hypothetical protein
VLPQHPAICYDLTMNRSSRRRLSGLVSFTAATVCIASSAFCTVSSLDDVLRASDVVVVAHPVGCTADAAAPLCLMVETVLLGAVSVEETLQVHGAETAPERAVWCLSLDPDGALRPVAEPRHPGWSDTIAAALPSTGLRLSLHRRWYQQGEPIIVTLELHNRGESSAAIPGLHRAGLRLFTDIDLPLDVHRIDGEESPPVDVRFVVASSLALGAPVQIEPGEAASVTFQLDDYADLKRPGLYRLRLDARPTWGAAEVRLFIQP